MHFCMSQNAAKNRKEESKQERLKNQALYNSA